VSNAVEGPAFAFAVAFAFALAVACPFVVIPKGICGCRSNRQSLLKTKINHPKTGGPD
jgi:hypothetical protein